METWLTWQYNCIQFGGCRAEWCKWKCIYAQVFIHPLSLCLLVGAFNPFIFKVIIYMYDPVTIFLIVLGWFSVGLFLLLCFLPREVPLAFVAKLVWWCWILLTFACLESVWFLHQIWRRVLLGRVFLAIGSSFSSFQIYRAIPFKFVEFLNRNSTRQKRMVWYI